MPNTKESPLEQTYTMVCDICGELFQSPDAFLDPQICPECRAASLPPEIQKIRETVAQSYYHQKIEEETGVSWEACKNDSHPYRREAFIFTDQLLSGLDKHRVVMLALDQERPDNPYPSDYKELPTEFQEEATGEDVYLMASNGFEKGIRYMKRDGWCKVVPIVDGTPVKEG